MYKLIANSFSRLGLGALFAIFYVAPALSTTLTLGTCITTGASCTDGGTTTVGVNTPSAHTLGYAEVAGGDSVTIPAYNSVTQLGSFTGPGTTWGGTGNATFNLFLTEGSTVLPAFTASIGQGSGVVTFTGTTASGWVAGTDAISGVVYATEYDASLHLLIGVQQTETIAGTGSTNLNGLLISTPEPATYVYMALGGLALFVARRRRLQVLS